MVSKSANYIFASPTNNIGYLLLCEVALGDFYELTHSEFVTKLPGKCLATKGLGRTYPNPDQNVTLPDGLVVPTGKFISNSNLSTSLLYNEFIVYDVSQIRVRYLLQVKFNFNYRR